LKQQTAEEEPNARRGVTEKCNYFLAQELAAGTGWSGVRHPNSEFPRPTQHHPA